MNLVSTYVLSSIHNKKYLNPLTEHQEICIYLSLKMVYLSFN